MNIPMASTLLMKLPLKPPFTPNSLCTKYYDIPFNTVIPKRSLPVTRINMEYILSLQRIVVVLLYTISGYK